MGLRTLDIKMSYAGKGDAILKEFLLPAIKESVQYDRVTSFYTVESLLAISQGIQSLYEKQGQMRLIVGIHSFPAELVEASVKRKYLYEQIKRVREEIKSGIMSLTDSLEKERLATLAWMIQDGLLEVKAASVKGEGIFHPKTLLLSDGKEKIVAVGSPNETKSGLGGNFEQIVIVSSWNDLQGVATQEEFFESLWNNKQEDVIVYDITEETADLILSSLGEGYRHPTGRESTVDVCEHVLQVSSQMPANFFVSGDIPALYMHQERAVIDALSRWPVRVLFADEVGLGKTFEVAATMAFLIKYCEVKKVVILTPKAVLKQWQEELSEHFKIDAWLFDSSSKTYISSNNRTIYIGSENPLGRRAPNIVLMSAQYARGSREKQDLFSKTGTILPDLLILDEAHSARISADISGNKKKTRMYRMLEEIAQKIPHLILATATPMQKDADEYHAILKLLGLPKEWRKERAYQTSLRLIASDDVPDISDAFSGASLLLKTISNMTPTLSRLNQRERVVLESLVAKANSKDRVDVGSYIQSAWTDFRTLFIKLHPAHLLTVRNTRRSLTEVGYSFPQRNLYEESIKDSQEIQMFYYEVNQYLTDSCFSIEQLLYPDRKISVGFVRVSYMQRVASSLHSCKKSLERRLMKVVNLKHWIDRHESQKDVRKYGLDYAANMDDIDIDDLLGDDGDYDTEEESAIDMKALRRAVGIESTALASLVNRANELLSKSGDKKIQRALDVALQCVNVGDTVLLFSRYTDTIDALISNFKARGADQELGYGIYTGGRAEIVTRGKSRVCDKGTIKAALFDGTIKVMFCSDAASEGLNLQAARVLINVDVPWTPARLEQRIGRIARLGQTAKEVDIYNVWYPYSIEARMYHRIQKRLEETNLAIGEFPEIVANSIRKAVIDDQPEDDSSLKQLKEIRNSYQVAALEELWGQENKGMTMSTEMREDLMKICRREFPAAGSSLGGKIQFFKMSTGKKIGLTAHDGMPESISLKSEPWQFKDFSLENVEIISDKEERPAVFVIKNSDTEKRLTHSSILKAILGETLTENWELKDYPQMLPDNKALDLRFAVECELEERPTIWIDE